jgi:hypothetical protein
LTLTALIVSPGAYVQSIRTAKKDCTALAEKAAQLVLTLHKEAASLDSNSPVYKRIEGNIVPFKACGSIFEHLV